MNLPFILTAKNSVWILLILAALTRLPWLSYPNQVIFDEVHFGKFVTAYCCTHQRIFDIHPPHVKLLIAGVSSLLGYSGGFSFDHIGQPFGDVSSVALRTVPALAGVLLPLVLYLLARQLGISQLAAFLLAAALVFDNALVIQSRVISLDTVLLVATFGSLSAFLAALKYTDWKQVAWFIVCGALVGLAAGSKFTGLTAALMVIVFIIWQLAEHHDKQAIAMWLARLLLLTVSALTVYSAGWALHYIVLSQPGPGDAWQVPTGNIVTDTIEMHQKMLAANYNLTATHPYSSHWWTWPLMQRPVFYWQGEGMRAIYFLGNPAVWWGGGLLFLAALVATLADAINKPLKECLNPQGLLMLVGFAIAFGPFVRIPRALFLYHYLMPLLFSLLFGIWWLDRTLHLEKFSLRQIPLWYWWTLAAIILAFIFFSPLTYGFPIADAWWHSLFWLPTWR